MLSGCRGLLNLFSLFVVFNKFTRFCEICVKLFVLFLFQFIRREEQRWRRRIDFKRNVFSGVRIKTSKEGACLRGANMFLSFWITMAGEKEISVEDILAGWDDCQHLLIPPSFRLNHKCDICTRYFASKDLISGFQCMTCYDEAKRKIYVTMDLYKKHRQQVHHDFDHKEKYVIMENACKRCAKKCVDELH